MNVKVWIEAMRLRTLPVSVAGVIAGTAYAVLAGGFEPVAAGLCLAFAVLAQIASNFGNEYFDFRAGLDRPGREGPRRGVTEGDITPRAMLVATLGTLAAACCVGLCLLMYGGWWLIAVGVFIAVGVLAYSAGPWPLSRHAMGEVAVILFFGLIPVTLTCYVQTHAWPTDALLGGLAIGLMGANVIIVNNYRDADADAAVGKTTLCVLIGRRATSYIYLANGFIAMALMLPVWLQIHAIAVPIVYLIAHCALYRQLTHRTGRAINPLLGMTACLMLAVALALVYGAFACL